MSRVIYHVEQLELETLLELKQTLEEKLNAVIAELEKRQEAA